MQVVSSMTFVDRKPQLGRDRGFYHARFAATEVGEPNWVEEVANGDKLMSKSGFSAKIGQFRGMIIVHL